MISRTTTQRLLTVEEFEQTENEARETDNELAVRLVAHVRMLSPVAVRAMRTAEEERQLRVTLHSRIQQARRLINMPRSKLKKDDLIALLGQIDGALSGEWGES